MKVLGPLAMAFSVYSRVPVPVFEWKDREIKYMLAFFPFIGALIGIILYLWHCLVMYAGLGMFCRVLFGTAIPLLITGGIHVDGFMDTMDAMSSYGSREKKLEILKDPHIGSFSVISLAVYGLMYLAAFYLVSDRSLTGVICCGFFLARALSGLSVMLFPPAKNEGMSYTIRSESENHRVTALLAIEVVACIILMAAISLWGLITALAAFVSWAWYYYKSEKEFGGVTGDTAGYFLLICELAMMITTAVISCLIK